MELFPAFPGGEVSNWRFELISVAGNGFDHFRVFAEFLAQGFDYGFDHVAAYVILVAPDIPIMASRATALPLRS